MASLINRYFHATKEMPPQRHWWRGVRRGMRSFYSKFPHWTHAHFQKIGSRIVSKPDRTALINFADTARTIQSQTTPTLQCGNGAPSEGLVSIHGIERNICLSKPWDADLGGVTYLWLMSSSYLNFIWDSEAPPEPSKIGAFGELIRAYSSTDAFCAPGAFGTFWHPYAASHRLVNLVIASCYADSYGDVALSQNLESAIGLHTAYVRANTEYDIHYNHLTKNIFALILSSVYRTGQAPQNLCREFERSVDWQVLPDGGHRELCPMYHNQFLTDLKIMQALPPDAVPNDFVDWIAEVVSRMAVASSVMSFDSGETALFSDSWFGDALTSTALGAVDCADGISALSDTGYVKLKRGAFEVIVDVGDIGAPDNPGHGHDDALSIEACFDGKRLVFDYGVESYEAGQGRERTRSKELHNGPCFKNFPSMDSWGAFRVGARAKRPVFREICSSNGWIAVDAWASPLGGEGRTCNRRVSVHEDFGIVIRDEWLGAEDGDSLQATFILRAGLKLVEDALNLGELQFSVVEGNVAAKEGIRFEVYAVPKQSTHLTVSPRLAANDTFVSTVHIGPRTLTTNELMAATQFRVLT